MTAMRAAVLAAGVVGWIVSQAAVAAAADSPITAASPEELAQVIGGGKWAIVEFGGEHCIPCKAMQPILQSLRDTLGNKVVIRNFWIQEHPEVARAHRVMVMPTQVVFDPQGKEVLRHMGVYRLEEFKAALAEKGLK